ncbi:transposase [Helicobacter suis]|uniref:Probable transposase IS891/IS1136/IS1341 domain-containing protein n=1 Tax=Helicobacter suis TaxID=104628 RepID=A0A6J4CZU4_9HELI|nr:hypothetical protein NHP190020_17140 [Helicobacter suis]BDR28076.1 hypothetical protein HSHS1_08370 [Helicobacter suis HS1]BCD47417.1 hypothetical protein NHP194003_06210 [Helicobacter suis]BCD49171.1 hypothetical protein NHP194004_06180 [Helicobacter suis]BCD51202.1 hypothetical protein NHP194022_08730 [Helicobacter suis]
MPLIRACSKFLSKKQRGSHRRFKAKIKLAKLHRKIKFLRTDFFYKLANHLAKQYTHVFIEDLDMKAMCKLWGRKISDLALASL